MAFLDGTLFDTVTVFLVFGIRDEHDSVDWHGPVCKGYTQ
jgi:hypothetical protein